MPKNYKPKVGAKKRVQYDSEIIAAAVAAMKNWGSFKGTAKQFNINVMTLKRIIRRGEDRLPGFKKAQIFKNEEELQLSEYLIQASRLNYGLSLKQFRELAYEFAKANNKKIPPSWESKKIAGRDWAKCFMERHSRLSLRTPEPTSLARSSTFNKFTVSTFFENYA